MRLSVSQMQAWLRCPRSYWYRYIAKVKSMMGHSNLEFGSCIDDTVNGFMQAIVDKMSFDPVHVFTQRWERVCEEVPMEFSSQHDEESMLKMGQRMMEIFPEAWDELDLVPLTDRNGKALVQQKLYTTYAHRLDFLVIPDILAKRRKGGNIISLDLKTAATAHTYEQTLLDDQLTAQQIGCDTNAQRLGIPQVHELGFLDIVKRKWPTKTGTGPKIETQIVPRRDEHTIKEFINTAKWIQRQISLGEYPRTPMQPFNSPCGICDFCNHCVYGDDEGLIWPEDQPEAAAA